MNITTGNFNAFYNFYNARGQYIAFCEGDDYWADPFKLQKQVDFLESNPGFGFVYHSFITIDTKGQKIESPEEIHQPKWDITKEELFKGKYHPLLLSICFRNIFTEIPRQMAEVLNVDTFLFSYLGKFGYAKFQPDIEPACYRQHPGGTWSHRKKENKFFSKIITYRGLSRYYLLQENKELYTFYFNRLQSNKKMLIYFYLKNGNLVSASKILSKLLLLRK
jgi:glycosyltransferase involved in cell wall biosynthesis